MNQEKVWDDFDALPSEAQQQVADFIAFLRTRHGKQRPNQNSPQIDLSEETFIGIWRDRSDMLDSTKWVREMREREWK